ASRRASTRNRLHRWPCPGHTAEALEPDQLSRPQLGVAIDLVFAPQGSTALRDWRCSGVRSTVPPQTMQKRPTSWTHSRGLQLLAQLLKTSLANKSDRAQRQSKLSRKLPVRACRCIEEEFHDQFTAARRQLSHRRSNELFFFCLPQECLRHLF